jgi:hypothetical protein
MTRGIPTRGFLGGIERKWKTIAIFTHRRTSSRAGLNIASSTRDQLRQSQNSETWKPVRISSVPVSGEHNVITSQLRVSPSNAFNGAGRMTMRSVQDSIRSSAHVHAYPRTSSQSISQLSSGGKPGCGRCRQDQFAEPQVDHEFDRRIALRTHGILLQIGASPFSNRTDAGTRQAFRKTNPFYLQRSWTARLSELGASSGVEGAAGCGLYRRGAGSIVRPQRLRCKTNPICRRAHRSRTSPRPPNKLFWLSRNGCRIELRVDCRTPPASSSTRETPL